MQTQQPNLYVAIFVTLGAATLALVLRLFARRMTKLSLGIDDYFVLGAYSFGVAFTALLLLWTDHGLGLHLKNIRLPEDQALYDSRLYLYFVELTYAFSLAFSKLAILCFYWRMFRTSSLKIPIIVLMVASMIWLILRTFMAIFHCIPVQAFWDKDIPDAICEIDDSKFFTGTVVAHLALDVAILTLPVLQIRKLKLRSSQKMGVTAMFMFGISVCIASVVVIVYSIQLDTTSIEVPWNIAPIMIWAEVEVNLAIVSACLPLLRPVFLKVLHIFRPDSTLGSSGGQYPSSHPKSFMKLGNMKKSSKIAVESDSTHNLATYDRCSDSEGDGRIMASQEGPWVMISGNRDSAMERGHSHGHQTRGIMVRSEMSQSVSHSR